MLEKKWIVKEDKGVEALKNINPVVGSILANRGLKKEEMIDFLEPKLSDLHDPFLLKDMDKAVKRIEKAVEKDEKVLIYGDYDVDGISSTSVLIRTFNKLGLTDVDYYIPNRLEEGYGMNIEAIKKIAKKEVDLIVTVDCGVTAVEQITLANKLGMDVVVTDHHTVGKKLPPAIAIINPKQKDCEYPFKELAGVGLAFKLTQALLDPGKDGEGIRSYLGLVALGSIADIVPLVGENRIIVKHGLDRINNPVLVDSFNVKVLKNEVGYKDKEVSAGAVGYFIAPCINAAGRLGQSEKAVKLFTTNSSNEKVALAKELRRMNKERQDITQEIKERTQDYIKKNKLNKKKVLVVPLKNAHSGVIGNVASDIQEEYYKPTILIALDNNGEGRGSARSIPNFHMYKAFEYCEDAFIGYGGHKQAGGFSIKEKDIELLDRKMQEFANKTLIEEDLIPKVKIDKVVNACNVSTELLHKLDKIKPFGYGNPKPTLVLKDTVAKDYKTIGKNKDHIKIDFTKESQEFDSIGWDLADVKNRLDGKNFDIDVAFTLGLNTYRGMNTLQLTIKDIKFPKMSLVDKLFAKKNDILGEDRYSGIVDAECFNTKAAGVSFEGRQEIIKEKVEDGDMVKLVREPDNEYDPNAIQVVTKDEKHQIGFLNAELAKHLAPIIDDGVEYQVAVSSVTGGDEHNYGVNLFISKKEIKSNKEEEEKLRQRRIELATKSEEEIIEECKNVLIDGYDFRPKQKEALGNLYKEKNSLVIFGTGRGKSAVFQTFAALKALTENKLSIILYPLRALINDQYHGMKENLSKLGLRVYMGSGSLTDFQREKLNHAIKNNELDILLITPEFLNYHLHKFKHLKEDLGLFVVDESHHIGLATKTFRPIYKKVDKLVDYFDDPVTIATTATAKDDVAQEIVNALKIEDVIIDDTVRENMQIVDKRGTGNKVDYIDKLVKKGEKTVVYANSRRKTIEIASELRRRNRDLADTIAFYNAGLSNKDRNWVEKQFRNDNLKTIIATSSFGEGVNVPNIRHVVLFHLNFNHTAFNQQCGRSGRDGEDAYVHLLYNDEDVRVNEFILNNMTPNIDILRNIYIMLNARKDKENKVYDTNKTLADLVEENINETVTDGSVSSALGIFEELGLIERLRDPKRVIQLIPTKEKIDITKSVRYQEGLNDKQVFDEFKDFALNNEDKELLDSINKPIYPSQPLKTF